MGFDEGRLQSHPLTPGARRGYRGIRCIQHNKIPLFRRLRLRIFIPDPEMGGATAERGERPLNPI